MTNVDKLMNGLKAEVTLEMGGNTDALMKEPANLQQEKAEVTPGNKDFYA